MPFPFLDASLVTDGIQLTIVNNCKETIWPGLLGTRGKITPQNGGFRLCSSEQLVINLPQNWSGRIWGRQGCCSDEKTGKFSCQTGDCAGLLQCNGIGGQPPATLIEMTLGTPKSPLHYYDVSLVDGFNIPVSMVPEGGCSGSGGGCGVAACEADLNACCPSNLVVKREGRAVGCKSDCLAAKTDRYCCTGEFANSESCRATVYGKMFKSICPRAYSYAFDEETGLMTCRAMKYVVTFCPSK